MQDTEPAPIAIVAMSGMFPKAIGTSQFWDTIVNKIDATANTPRDRWIGPYDWVYNQRGQPDHAYSQYAALIQDYAFDSSGFAIESHSLDQMDPLYHWILEASRTAWHQTQVNDDQKPRVGVILAAIALPTEFSSSISRKLILDAQLPERFGRRTSGPLSKIEGLSGRIVGTPATVVSHALNLGGCAYTLDAACASSLYAVKLACGELRSYRADAMLAGGVSRPDPLYTQIGFSQLQALSPSGRCAPFDETADGLVVGEGAGVLVLKRLEDAVSSKDTIYGVIRGIGLSNDMRGNLLAPESAGQLRCMRMAYEQAGWRPCDVDYIECHGAGTPVGDATELQSLRALWGGEKWEQGQCAIGSVKSNIGHLLTAAGAAGMIKTLLALHHKTLPPSLKFTSPKSDSPLHGSPFHVQTVAEPWELRDERTTRKAAVSAFGFGGINAHILIEEWPDSTPVDSRCLPIETADAIQETPMPCTGVAIVGMDLTAGPLDTVASFRRALFTADSVLSAAPASRWKSPEAAAAALGRRNPVGAFVESIEVEVGEYTIPPGELPDILPQQLLMLKKAAGAMKDAGLPLRKTRDRMGTIIGIGFDYEATNFHLRWALPHIVSRLVAKGSGTIADEELERWMIETKDQCGPPLTAARTLGALGGIVASRIAREFRFGGPSFAVSAEEASGLRAAEIGMHLLQSGELDAVLIGAVDLNCDERNLTTLKPLLQFSESGQVRPFDYHADGTLPGEGAVALVLKRLEDAQADGDRIYAVIKGMGTAGFSGATLTPAAKTYSISLERAFKAAGMTPDLIQLILAHGSGIPNQDRLEGDALSGVFHATHRAAEDAVAIGTTTPVIGHTGAASGLLSLAAAAICLRHRILPPVVNYESPLQEHWNRSCFHLPAKSAYWAHNRSEGPRGAVAAAITTDGNCMHAVLQEAKPEYRIGSDGGHSLKHPAGPLPYGLFLISGNDSHQLIENLKTLESSSQSALSSEDTHIGQLAEAWHNRNSTRHHERFPLAVLARSVKDLHTRSVEARAAVENGLTCTMSDRGGISYFGSTDAREGRLAFVYPGSGNHYVGMGRNLGLHWPEVLCAMEESTDHFRTQWLPQWYDPWRVDWRSGWRQQAYDALVSDPLNTIFGQVLFGGQMTGLLRSFNLSPDAVIGYSLGESAGLFAMGAWPDRGQMLDRLSSTNLFKDELCGSCTALRQAWQLPEDQEVTWSAAAVNRGAADVDQAVADWPYVRRLIVNTPGQCVIGGLKEQVAQAIKQMACEAVYLDGVVTVHCDAALPAEQAYRDLHRFDTTPVEGVDFYSCAFEKIIDLTSESAAESITRQAMGGFDFPATIEQAYADGIRVFVEVGPHSSCTRMIGDILGDKDHLAVAANQRGENELLTLLKCLGTLAAAGMKLDLAPLYLGTPVLEPDRRSAATIEVRVGNGPLYLTPPDFSAGSGAIEARRPPQPSSRQTHAGTSSPAAPGGAVEGLDYDSIFKQMQETIDATARTHEKFLELSKDLTASYGKAFERQNDLIAAMAEAGIHIDASLPEGPDATYGADTETAARAPSDAEPHQQTRIAFNREQCMEFAIGSVGKVLGPQFDIVDTFSARVRLPDEPLMLVDRILQVDGEKLSLGSGRVVTEHDVLPDMWYLDGNRAPVCISVEAGQADLFLSAYLGIDHRVRGERTYRLLDATIRFHRGLPRPGETIRYDIHIDKFVRQKETYLFFFHYEGHIGNEHLITMTRGCAGFFTEAEVRHSGGIILTDEDRAPGATVEGSSYAPLVPLFAGTDDAEVDALRSGDAGACFGQPILPAFACPVPCVSLAAACA
jgi:acyl transferase domain-containing protein